MSRKKIIPYFCAFISFIILEIAGFAYVLYFSMFAAPVYNVTEREMYGPPTEENSFWISEEQRLEIEDFLKNKISCDELWNSDTSNLEVSKCVREELRKYADYKNNNSSAQSVLPAEALQSYINNGNRFFCGELSLLFAYVLNSENIPVRIVQLIGSADGTEPYYPKTARDSHVLVEVWSPMYQKWVASDISFNARVRDINDIPLSVAEIRKVVGQYRDDPRVLSGKTSIEEVAPIQIKYGTRDLRAPDFESFFGSTGEDVLLMYDHIFIQTGEPIGDMPFPLGFIKGRYWPSFRYNYVIDDKHPPLVIPILNLYLNYVGPLLILFFAFLIILKLRLQFKNFFRKVKKVFLSPPGKIFFYALGYLKRSARKFYFICGFYKIFSGGFIGNYSIPGKNILDYFSGRKSQLGDFWAEYFKENINSPDRNNLTREADRICGHYFNLLGSGEKYLGEKIDWRVDFKSGRCWPLKWAFDLPFGEGDGSDIKVPWELSRFYHLPFLIKAYVLTGDGKYAKEFEAQFLGWKRDNPLYLGPNWMNAMEAAIRACNLIFAYEAFVSLGYKFEKKFIEEYLISVVEHGNFIWDNLENLGTKSNHFISDLTGLVYIAAVYPELKDSQKWIGFAVRAIREEMQNEVYGDGVDYEASAYYHRLVTELFGHSGLIFKIYKIDAAFDFWIRLERMIDFTKNYIKPNGLAPIIGDSDDGRLHFIFDRSYFGWDNRDHRHILELGKLLFKKDFSLADAKSRGYEDAQIFIMRSKDVYAIVDAGDVGQGGNGGHAHNDVFSFEYNFGGNDFIIDPGTYNYTAYPDERNLFRATLSHNTVRVDGEEQNRFREELLFMMANDAKPKVLKWETSAGRDMLEAEHYGYRRLSDPVTHNRSFILDKKDDVFIIEDRFDCKEGHLFEWNFQFAQGVVVKNLKNEDGELSCILSCAGVGAVLTFSYPNIMLTEAQVIDLWTSLRYGMKEGSSALRVRLRDMVEKKDIFRTKIRRI